VPKVNRTSSPKWNRSLMYAEHGAAWVFTPGYGPGLMSTHMYRVARNGAGSGSRRRTHTH
jgi:hypothetical protein